MKKLKRILLLYFISSTVLAYESVQVVGLFPGKAVVVADGERFILSQGQLKNGLKLLDIEGDTVTIDINGETKQIKLGSVISTQFKSPEVRRKSIRANQYGMFMTAGSINGQLIHFLVDTGATTIAMSSDKARNLGIQYRLEGKETTARTASGLAKAYRVKLNSVKVGEIHQRNVDALVIDGSYPKQVLLGMSFLNRVKVEKQGDLMLLEAR